MLEAREGLLDDGYSTVLHSHIDHPLLLGVLCIEGLQLGEGEGRRSDAIELGDLVDDRNGLGVPSSRQQKFGTLVKVEDGESEDENAECDGAEGCEKSEVSSCSFLKALVRAPGRSRD